MGYYFNKMTIECHNLSHENTDSNILNAILILLGLELKTPSVFRLLASSFPPQHLVPVTPLRGRPVRGARPRFCVGLERGLDGGDGGQGQSAPPCAPQQKLWRLKTSERRDRRSCGRRRGRREAALCSIFTRSSWSLQDCSMSGFAFPQTASGLSDNRLPPSNDFQWLCNVFPPSH